MASIVYSGLARADLAEIWAFIAERDGERRAEAVLERIERRINQLADHPELGPSRPEIGPGARSLTCERWLALYDIRRENVRIIRIVDGARDLTIAWPAGAR